MHLDAAEPYRDVLECFESPEQNARFADIVNRQTCFEECTLQALAFPRRKRDGEQPARHAR